MNNFYKLIRYHGLRLTWYHVKIAKIYRINYFEKSSTDIYLIHDTLIRRIHSRKIIALPFENLNTHCKDKLYIYTRINFLNSKISQIHQTELLITRVLEIPPSQKTQERERERLLSSPLIKKRYTHFLITRRVRGP